MVGGNPYELIISNAIRMGNAYATVPKDPTRQP